MKIATTGLSSTRTMMSIGDITTDMGTDIVMDTNLIISLIPKRLAITGTQPLIMEHQERHMRTLVMQSVGNCTMSLNRCVESIKVMVTGEWSDVAPGQRDRLLSTGVPRG